MGEAISVDETWGVVRGKLNRQVIGQISTHCQHPAGRTIGNKQSMGRSRHVMLDDVAKFKVRYDNFYMASQVETASGGDMTLSLCVEYPVGVFTRVRFAGALKGIAPDGGYAISDWINLRIPVGDVFYLRLWTDNQGGGIVYTGKQDTANGELFAYGVTTADLSGGGTITSSDTSNILLPSAIIGYTAKGSAIIMGDSRAFGDNNANSDYAGADSTGATGEIERALQAQGVPYINIAGNADQAVYFLASNAKRLSLASYCSHGVLEYGINDINAASRTAAQLATDRASIRKLLPVGMACYLTTMPPITTSTDGWVTTANQTQGMTGTKEGYRTTANDAARAVPVGFAGCIDICSAVESALNSGLWKAANPALTGDGTHETYTGNALIRDSGIMTAAMFVRDAA